MFWAISKKMSYTYHHIRIYPEFALQQTVEKNRVLLQNYAYFSDPWCGRFGSDFNLYSHIAQNAADKAFPKSTSEASSTQTLFLLQNCNLEHSYAMLASFHGHSSTTAHFRGTTAWCSEIGSVTSLDACDSGASSDVREPISLHQAVQPLHIHPAR